MATGALDANGVWQHDEDDNLSPWSGSGGYINKVGASISALFGAWTTVTPSFTNLTVGNGTLVGRYKKIGKKVTYMGNFVYGTTSAVGTNPTLTLPVASVGVYNAFQVFGPAGLYDLGTANQIGWVRWSTTTAAVFMPNSGTGITSTYPWTWATGDVITWNITYEAA